uniref:Zinc metalloproteinase-disintegrin-like brevilysin H2b n=1 Tax=Gloydius brevicauda TaxID=3148161 RepID=VM32B_GLOBR|nr:RecName: Full=Zinc metalloproteinase-disintegrin-like brevilysin H2b; AltName: Full=Snake venom metalloproteinase; Short=SVMP [Gloydius brevicaudus]
QQRYLNAKRYVKLAIVADRSMVTKHNGKLKKLRKWIYRIVNTINEVYRSLNILVALVYLEIWSKEDLINVTSAAKDTLASFGNWRATDLLKRRSHDAAHLLTNIKFDGTTVGKAYVASMCQQDSSVGINQDHSKINLLVALTMAHELGHNLGMSHDVVNTEKQCNCGTCVMAPTISDQISKLFSNCSKNDYENFLTLYKPQCILNEPSKTDIVSPPVCGNELLEVGEECDCGSPETCQNPCCDAATCKLTSGSQCAKGLCCDQCKFSKSGTECRAAKDDCDIAESCTGQSADCPTDDLQRNGQPCGNNAQYCRKGKCPIMTNQCISFYGPNAAVAPDACFDYNLKGEGNFYCRKEQATIFPCAQKDKKCGRLFCVLGPTGKRISCEHTYSQDDPDIGMVLPGTKCADGKVCNSNRECVDVNTAY